MADQIDRGLVVVFRRNLADVVAFLQLKRKHMTGRMAMNYSRNNHPGIILVKLPEQFNVAGFVLVVQLFPQALANLCEQLVNRLFRHFQQAAELESQAQLFQIGIAGLINTRILYFYNHIGAVVQPGAVHLAY